MSLTSGWTTVRVRKPKERAAIIEALFQLGAEGVQELADEIVTHFRGANEERVTQAVQTADPTAAVEYTPTPDVDWSEEWRSRIGAHSLGPIVVTPPWLADLYQERERVVIDPGMAFGTGEHETTRGVVRLLSGVIRVGDTVADLGAGSAVLAIAAAKLGASRVVAIELDPEAIGNAEANVERNDVTDVVFVVEGDAALLLPLVAPVRIVLANIISSVLVALLPVIAKALTADGVAILSGILVGERESMEQVIGKSGWRILETDAEGMWWTVAISR